MKNNYIVYLSVFLVVMIASLFLMKTFSGSKTHEITAKVLNVNSSSMTIQDDSDSIYKLSIDNSKVNVGDLVVVKYTGLLNSDDYEVISYSVLPTSIDSDSEDNNTNFKSFTPDGIFKNYYNLAINKLNSLTLDEKIGQLLLVKYPTTNQVNILKKYNLAGFVFYENDFKNKTKFEVVNMMKELQDASKIPLLTAVDEEGGRVIRVSSNSNLVESPYLSPSELYKTGGLDLIKKDTISKSKTLYDLGINLNLAPVVDVATDPDSYIYSRTLQENTEITSNYAKTVIEASKGTGVSYTLKHFPGYGNNSDTHVARSTDNRDYDDIVDNDLPPFKAGIDALAEAVLISHNVVSSIDPDNPASLSEDVHKLLRNDLDFTGVIITDDLAMESVNNIPNSVVKAIKAGNDLLIISDYEDAYNQIKDALDNGTLTEDDINNSAGRILAWKYYKGLMIDKQK